MAKTVHECHEEASQTPRGYMQPMCWEPRTQPCLLKAKAIFKTQLLCKLSASYSESSWVGGLSESTPQLHKYLLSIYYV